MAHNFREILGLNPVMYISKSGHDSNDGLTPDTPKRTINSTSPKQIGAGHYISPTVSFVDTVGDGKVIVDFNGNSASGNFLRNRNLEFRNINGGAFSSSEQTNPPSENIIFKDCNFAITPSQLRKLFFSKCIFINYLGRISSVSQYSPGDIKESIFYNCQIETENWPFYDVYVDKSSQITVTKNHTGSFVISGNIRGVIKYSGVFFPDGAARKYVIKDELTGTPYDYSYAADVEWLTVDNLTNAGYNGNMTHIQNIVANCINRDPLFNSEQTLDFTLQAGSPHLGRSSSGGNIGGTSAAVTVMNHDDGINGTEVIPSAEIETANSDYFTVKTNETEGYIDYIQRIGSKPVILQEISPITSLNFNSDYAGGTTNNKNVPDSEPLSIEYPRKFITTSASSDALTIVCNGHDAQIGEFVRVLGEDREVTGVTSTTITLSSALRAAIVNGTEFQVGAKTQIGALNPNRLTYMMRTSKEETKPTTDSQWDNDIDPSYGKAGQFITQEWDTIPVYLIDDSTGEVYGGGDSETPYGLLTNEISAVWVHIRVYIRNNYDS